jgi:hypothetical protein
MDGCRGNPLEGGDMVECVHCNVEGGCLWRIFVRALNINDSGFPKWLMTKALEITFTTFKKLNLKELCRVIQDMLPIKKWGKLGY